MRAGQLIRVATGVLRDGPTPLLVARRAIRHFDAIQRTWELQSLVALVRQMKPKTVVEIGTYKGGTLTCWAAVAQPAAQIVGIDMPFPWVDKEAVAISIGKVRTMLRPSQRLTVITADSHDVATLVGLREALAGALIDVLWIDGDHTYEGVRQDVRMYGELVRPGGIIALHDIQRSDLFPDQQSDVYWQELKAHALAAVDYVTRTPDLGVDARRMGMVGWSFGGMVTTLAMGRDKRFSAGSVQAPAAANWNGKPIVQAALVKAAKAIRSPMLCAVAENDTQTESTRAICAAVRANGVPAELKIYPAFTPPPPAPGTTNQPPGPNAPAPGHAIFTAAGVAIWGSDLAAFLQKYMPGK